MKINKHAFTLIELIVVITILSILGTIAFISLQGYSAQARDSKRLADIQNIKKSLELFQVGIGQYPKIKGGYNVTYSGGLVWTQGTINNDIVSNLSKNLKQKPLDPLTENEYTYSLSNSGKEYEIAGIIESDLFALNKVINKTNAIESKFVAKVTGNYNGELLKVNKSGLQCIVAIPSIITSTGTKLINIIKNNLFVYNRFKNLPLNYKNNNNNLKLIGENNLKLVNESNIDLYCGDINKLKTNESARLSFINNLKKAYSGTQIEKNGRMGKILSLEIDENNPTIELKTFLIDLVEEEFSLKISEKQKKLANKCNIDYHNELGVCVPNTKSILISNGVGKQLWTGKDWGTISITTCNEGFVFASNSCESKNIGGIDDFIGKKILIGETVKLNGDGFSNKIFERCNYYGLEELWSDNCNDLGNSLVVITTGSRYNLPEALNGSRINLTKIIGTEPNYTTIGVPYNGNNSYYQWFYSTSGLFVKNMVDNPCGSNGVDFDNARCTKSANASSYSYSCGPTTCYKYCSGSCCHWVTPTCHGTSYSCDSGWTLFDSSKCYKNFSDI